MNVPRGGALAGLVAVAALVAASAVVLAGEYGASPYSFPHQPHLSAETVAAALADAAATDRTGKGLGGGGTTDAECRKCHDYARDAASHLSSCGQCHVEKGGAKHLDVDLAPAPAGSSFPHASHLKDPAITCFSCHRLRKEMGWLEFTNPAGGLGAAGAAGRPGGAHGEFTCTDCHAKHEPGSQTVKQFARTGDGRPCVQCHGSASAIVPKRYRTGAGAAAAQQGTFRHADHGGADGDCDSCHSAIRGSRTIWDYDPTAGTKEACERCHVDAEKRPLVGLAQPPRETTVPRVLFSRFPHDRHLAKPEGKIETSGQVTDACRTCHYPERDGTASRLFPGRKPSSEPAGRSDLVDYDACTPCHAAWKVEGHGVGAWSCFKCHSGVTAENGALAMGRTKVARGALTAGVRFTKHHHPGVTSSGAPLVDPKEVGGKTCRDCHRGDIAALTSRLVDARAVFHHAPHIPANPSSADCIGCHTTVATSSWSADLSRFDPHLDAPPTASGVSGGARGCLACHAGATAADLGIAVAERIVPEFDHRSHVVGAKWNGGTGIACTECHTGGGTAGYTTPDDVTSCVRCHSHDEKDAVKFARTGKKSPSPDDAKDCVRCHDPVNERPSPVVAAPRKHLSLLQGTQHHDKSADCASCHAREGRAYAYQERIRKAKVALSIHEDPALRGEWFNDPKISAAGADVQGRTCRTCHRQEPRGYLRPAGGAK